MKPTLDDALGRAMPGRIHLVTGDPGSGKTSVALHFLTKGIASGELAVLITRDRSSDLRSTADFCAVPLASLIRSGKLLVLRFGEGFAQRLIELATPAELVAELEEEIALLRSFLPRNGTQRLRIAIDPVSLFVPSADLSGAALDALAGWLDSIESTSLLTWTGDLAMGTDRRIDALGERAGVILRLERGARAQSHRARVVRARHHLASAGTIAFSILPGRGVTCGNGKEKAPRLEIPVTQMADVLQHTFGGGAVDVGASPS